MSDRPPLNWEASAHSNNPTVSDALPPEVASSFRNARFLHLATSSPSAEPHISLMSHTFLPSTPFYAGPTIIMTTNPASRKTAHLTANPRVSLLVHDWVSPRDDRAPASADDGGSGSGSGHPTAATTTTTITGADSSSSTALSPSPQPSSSRTRRTADGGGGGDAGAARRRPSSSLASMLLGFNRAALGRISVTVAGTARVLEHGGAEERWCRARHVASHGYKGAVEEDEGAGDDAMQDAAAPGSSAVEEGFLAGEDVRVVVVTIRDGRIADWRGGVKDFVIRAPEGDRETAANGASR